MREFIAAARAEGLSVYLSSGYRTYADQNYLYNRKIGQGYSPEDAAKIVGAALPVAKKDEVKTGKATILATVSGNETREYDIEIEKIYSPSGSTRNLLLRVTDEELLAQTGGVVQGMSGSAILQDGKIIGAVTHVLLDDPSRGYGIFIENMLSAAGLSSE